MEKNKAICYNCFEAITDPICTNCLTTHLRYWLNDNYLDLSQKRQILNFAKNLLKKESLNNDSCIICGKEAFNLCSYCFSSKLSFKLNKLNLSENLIDDFEYLFTDKFLNFENGINIKE